MGWQVTAWMTEPTALVCLAGIFQRKDVNILKIENVLLNLLLFLIVLQLKLRKNANQ